MNTFGEKIRDLRKEKNLTQKEMAQALSVTISTLSHWECEYQEPSFKDLVSLADFFEVSTDYLLGLSENDTPAFKNSSAPTLPKDEKELLELYRQLPFESKQRLIARAEVMLEDTQEKKTKHGA